MSQIKPSFSTENLLPYMPENLANYCMGLLEPFEVRIKITKSRKSKFGDYRKLRSNGKHQITINEDLPSQAFVITFLHEIAHLLAYAKHGRRIKPHGTEWKSIFRMILAPAMRGDFFDKNVLAALIDYIQNPRASTASHHALYKQLHIADDENTTETHLDEVPVNASFKIGKRILKKLQTRRTRVLCLDESTNRQYLVHRLAEVEPL